MRSVPRLAALPGRGALSNHPSRYDAVVTDRTYASEPATHDDDPPRARPTRLHRDAARSIISTNQSPDVPFAQSINPYRGCEHGCIYCFARPSHARLGWSPGLDFEAEIHFKPDARALLEAALARPGYRPQPIHLGANTDPYQPVERRLQLTRSLLEGFLEARHPVTVLTKGALIERDIDVLSALARLRLTRVAISLTTLNDATKRTLEPRAASPQARLRVIRRLHEAGVPVGVMVAPVIPKVTDHELEDILAAARAAGADHAGWILLRLPLEVEPLMREWLETHRPQAADAVYSILAAFHGGQTYDSRFAYRKRGQGPFAELFRQRFALAARRLGLATDAPAALDASAFRPPSPGGQLGLF